jgi:hypothetical protein
VFLALFGPEERAALQRSGIIFATQAVSGNTADDPVFDNLRADAEDLRMVSRHLLEVSRVRHGSKVSDREHELCR